MPVTDRRPRIDAAQLLYEALPEVIKTQVTLKEFCWLSDEERYNLQADLTSPPDEAEY